LSPHAYRLSSTLVACGDHQCAWQSVTSRRIVGTESISNVREYAVVDPSVTLISLSLVSRCQPRAYQRNTPPRLKQGSKELTC
jgi:hypothetical protein